MQLRIQSLVLPLDWLVNILDVVKYTYQSINMFVCMYMHVCTLIECPSIVDILLNINSDIRNFGSINDTKEISNRKGFKRNIFSGLFVCL